jgi:heme/copper-type cytochrome/quinol oxidase subunit 2
MLDAYNDPSSLFSLAEARPGIVLPILSNILVLVTSTDVIHRWAIPRLGVKADCNPGRLNSLWLMSHYPMLALRNCFELCGAYHSRIPIKVEFSTPALFVNWCKNGLFQGRLFKTPNL